jgi:hypothetical protein
VGVESECDQAVLAWADAARELTIPLMKSSVADDDVDDVAVRAGKLHPCPDKLRCNANGDSQHPNPPTAQNLTVPNSYNFEEAWAWQQGALPPTLPPLPMHGTGGLWLALPAFSPG